MNLADLLLRLGGLFHGGIEQDEVLVLGFSLSQTGGAAFAKPTVGDGELGFGEELALIVGIDQSVQSAARDLVTAMFDVANGTIKQNLIRLFGVLGDRVVIFLGAKTAGGQKPRQHHRNEKMSCCIKPCCHIQPYRLNL